MNLFFLASDLGTTATAEQLALLAGALPREQFSLAVGVLGPVSGPATAVLQAAGVSVVACPIRGPFDLAGMRWLRRTVAAANPAVVHAFGPAAVRAAQLVVTHTRDGNRPRLVASAAIVPEAGLGGWLTRRQLRLADRVIATGWGQGERYRQLGVRGERLTRIAPAAPLPGDAPEHATFCRDIGAPVESRFIFAGGQLDSGYGAKDAVMAFDMIRYELPALQLVLTGDGLDRTEVEELSRALAFDDIRVRFSGPRPDLAAATRLAEMVWVTGKHGGEHQALRAMAAGKPVIAFHTPELAEVIDDGTTGYLVSQGDRGAIAARSHVLLADPAQGAKLGEAGRARAAERFGVARMAEMHARVYQELT